MRRKIVAGVACLGIISLLTLADVKSVRAEEAESGAPVAGIASVLEDYRATSENADEDIKVFLEGEDGSSVAGLGSVLEDYKANTENADEDIKVILDDSTKELSKYSNIAVSQVNNYVNIRSEANTESEVVGKIYNECMADIKETVETEDGKWYLIESGTVTGYIKAEYFITGDAAAQLAAQISKLSCDISEGGVRLRAEPSLESEIVTLLFEGQTLTVTEEGEEFVKVVDEDGTEGYVASELVSTYVDFDEALSLEEEAAMIAEQERIAAEKAAQEEAARQQAAAQNSAQSSSSGTSSSSGSSSSSNNASSNAAAAAPETSSNAGTTATREAIVAFALQFNGNPYVWGGTSLTNGADCSGFTQSVFKNFGISLPRTSSAQAGAGTAVSSANIRPGDIVYYGGHVALYIGNGQIIHASDERTGIKISSWTYTTPLAIRNVIGD